MSEKPLGYQIYDGGAYAGLPDEPVWRSATMEAHGLEEGSPGLEDALARIAAQQGADDLELEVYYLDYRMIERVEAAHPNWCDLHDHAYELMVRGTVGRWDGAHTGHQYYEGGARGAADRLVWDPDGPLRDCEIDSIWEDRGGTVHIEGYHHDGRVALECRAVAPGTEDAELELREWNGAPKPGLEEFVEAAWEGGLRHDMAGYYGYEWRDATALDELERACTEQARQADPAPGRERPAEAR